MVVAGMVSSCMNLDDYDFERLSEVKWNPDYAVPLIHGSLGINNLLNEEDSAALLEYEDGLYYLVYEDLLESRDLNDLIGIPDNSTAKNYMVPAAVTIPAHTAQDIHHVQEELDLDIGPEQLHEAGIKSGSLSYSISTTIDASVNVEVTFPTVKDSNGEPLAIVANFYQGQLFQTVSDQVDLGNRIMDFTQLTPAYNKFPFIFKATVHTGAEPVLVDPTDFFELNLNFSDIQYRFVTGYFGKKTVDIPGDVVKIGFLGDTFDDADISIKDVKIDLKVVNEYGISGEVSFDVFEARKAGDAIQVYTDPESPVAITSPSHPTESSSTEVSVTNGAEIFNFMPEELYYKTSATINVDDIPVINYLTDTSNFAVYFRTEIPLHGSIQKISLNDTLDISLGEDLNETDVEKALVKVNVVNEFPVNANVQLYFTDENYAIIDSLFPENQTNVVKAAKVDDNGDPVTNGAGEYDELIEIDQDKFDNLMKASHILLKADLSTTRNEDNTYPNVKFKSGYRVYINLGIQTKLNLSIKP